MLTRTALGALLAGSFLGGAALARCDGGAEPASATDTVRPPTTPKAAAPTTGRPSPAPRRPSPSAEPTKPPEVPASGSGTFTTARASGDAVGSGPLRRYRVQVEDSIDMSAEEAAAEIQMILAHKRSWAAHGRGSFQLVSTDADFVIKIATPATADRLCGAQGLHTGGELNCETLEGVVVNLRRWMLGSPKFDGTPAQYRHLIINHEIGHEIGIRTHLGCSGPGRLAPVMMQQIKGLNGCLSNAWPYDKDGTYVTGPAVG